MRIDRYKYLNNVLFLYVFFITCPILVIKTNVSFFLFIVFLFRFFRVGYYSLKFNYNYVLYGFFIIATIFSVLYSVNSYRSVTDLPNYLYWATIGCIFTSYRKNMNFNLIYKSISYATIFF